MKQSRIHKRQAKNIDKKITTNNPFFTFRCVLKQILLLERMKAFITDIFMVYMPILYVATYIVLGSKEQFQSSQIALFICFCLYAIILSIFFAKKSQTLGYMYANIALVKDNKDLIKSMLDSNQDSLKDCKVGFLRSMCRFLLFCVSMSLVFGLFVPFVRRDKKTFHDALCKTTVVKYTRNNPNLK